ncbi:MAG: pyridoxamine 5'-phosphate oxidase [Chloroflexia bacterium]|nr:pyridoxamine 5'-phosphate oxidase [Chloroflexia bacterium]
MLRDLSNKKSNYTLSSLSKKEVDKDPVKQFVSWLDIAINEQVEEPNAMVLSTVGSDLKPSSRVVLLKGVGNEGFVFYTNYLSRKGNELAYNNNASLVFFWPELERQVRVEGVVKKLKPELSDEYFNKRHQDSKIGAIISPQSQIIPNRDFLMEKKRKLEEEVTENDLKRPNYWGGYILSPNLFEFWQGRPNRLNDRIQYSLEDNNWKIVRLAP